MKYILNPTPVRTSNNFGINDITIDFKLGHQIILVLMILLLNLKFLKPISLIKCLLKTIKI